MKNFIIYIVCFLPFSLVVADLKAPKNNQFSNQQEFDLKEKVKPFIVGAFGLQTTNMLIREVSKCQLSKRETKGHAESDTYRLTIKVCYELMVSLDEKIPREFAQVDTVDTFDEYFDGKSETQLEDARLKCNERRIELIKMADIERRRLIDVDSTEFLNRCFEYGNTNSIK